PLVTALAKFATAANHQRDLTTIYSLHSRLPPLVSHLLSLTILRPPSFTLFPYTTLFRSSRSRARRRACIRAEATPCPPSSRGGEIGRDTSELQSPYELVCRLLLEKKKTDRRRLYPHGR